MEDLGFLAPCFSCSEEEVGLAVADVVCDNSVNSAARMNGAVMLFLDSVDKVNAVVVSGIVVRAVVYKVLKSHTRFKMFYLSHTHTGCAVK